MQARAAKHLTLVYLKLISSGLLLSPKKKNRKNMVDFKGHPQGIPEPISNQSLLKS